MKAIINLVKRDLVGKKEHEVKEDKAFLMVLLVFKAPKDSQGMLEMKDLLDPREQPVSLDKKELKEWKEQQDTLAYMD